jgi:multicomponent Na+:H+ antiporter subunit C
MNSLAALGNEYFLYFLGAFGLIAIGFWMVLSSRNLIKIIIGLNIAEAGVNLFIVILGYFRGKTAPIFSNSGLEATKMVDPLPQALVLTAIVIGVSVTALALGLVMKIYERNKSIDVADIKNLKW